MNHNNDPKDASKTILALSVVLLAIVLREATLGTLSLMWTALMAGIVISLSLLNFGSRPEGRRRSDH